MNFRAGLIAVCVLAVAPFAFADEPNDIDALEALDRAYVDAWLAGDAEGVLELFTDNASIVPHHGVMPILGKEAIRKFWFDPSYPPTVVREWEREPEEAIVEGDIGVVRGRARLVWEYDGVRTTIPEMNTLMIAVRDGSDWRIRMLMWNDDPRSWEQLALETED